MGERKKNTAHKEEQGTDIKAELKQQAEVTEQTESGKSEPETRTNVVSDVNQDKIELLQSELEEQKEKYLRLVAEFDNFRRRSRKEHYELEQTAGKNIITSLLVVLDDMDRAAKQMELATEIDTIREGVSLVFSKMRSVMQKTGLRVMETKKEDFNPDLHEAITEIPVNSEELQGMIIDVIEPGYYLNDKLIRCAKVVIGKVGDLKGL